MKARANKKENVVYYERLDRKASDYREKFEKQLDDFERDAKSGKTLCLSDLMINAGM